MSACYRFSEGPWKGGGESIRFIHAVNESAERRGKTIFGTPIAEGERDWGGERRFVEEYKEAWVIGPLKNNFDGWRIIARTKRAERHFAKAAEQMSLVGA